ncbi:MAG: hypothetical protein KF712_03810 [Akkermansiaceae bacterium]|nr:hypothetical protein [Akkermansiaceae bacterium]
MTARPSDRSEFWINFACFFVAFGTIVVLFACQIPARIDSPANVAVTASVLLITTTVSFFAARHGSGDPAPLPYDSPCRIRFIISFVVFGILAGVVILRIFHRIESPAVLGISWLLFTTATSTYAARHGDDTWSGVLGFFRWW